MEVWENMESELEHIDEDNKEHGILVKRVIHALKKADKAHECLDEQV